MADGMTKFDPATHIDATKKAWLARQEIYKKMYYRKSKYPPMSIEPFPHERQRLPFQMTAEDRALRQQWLRDQQLTPREPRYVPENIPRNFFRRVFGYPWDAVTKLSTSVIVSELVCCAFLARSRWVNDISQHQQLLLLLPIIRV